MIAEQHRTTIRIIALATSVVWLAACTKSAPSSMEAASSDTASIDSSGDCETDPCVEIKPEPVATHKIGDVYIYVPRFFLQQPVESIWEIDGLGLSVCWPGIDRDRTSCAPVTDRIKLNIRPGPPAGSVPHMTSADRLAELTRSYDGPFRIEGTSVDEYQNRRDGTPVVFASGSEATANPYLIADCRGRIACRVDVREHHGLSLRYDFGINQISDWPQIDRQIKTLVASFIVESE